MPNTGGVTLVSDNAQVGADVIKTGNIKDAEIVNADISATAAIAKSKLAALAIVNADIDAGAAIAKSKLAALDIVNADVNASAAIVDTKLAQITTASKVSGAAITNLASLPAGAGQIPAANLGGISLVPLESGSLGDIMRVVKYYATGKCAGAGQQANYGGNSSLRQKFAYRVVGNGVSMSSLKTDLRKTGSPTNNSVVRIETDNAGVPSGTLADANATSTFANSGFTTSFADTTITFGGAFTLTAGTTYWLVFDVDGTYSDTNFMEIGILNGADAGMGNRTHNGTTWATPADNNNSIYIGSAAGIYLTGIVKHRQTICDNNLIGMANADYTQGTAVSLTGRGGIITGMSGLTPGYFYKPAATGVLATGNTTDTDGVDVILVALTTTTGLVLGRP